MRALLLAAIAAATIPTASHAATVRPCGAGYVGVVVSDSSGDRLVACVYIQDVRDQVDEVVRRAQAVAQWATRDVVAYVRSCEVNDPGDPTIAECDEIPFPPL